MLQNHLIILTRRELYSELVSNLHLVSVEDFLARFKDSIEERSNNKSLDSKMSDLSLMKGDSVFKDKCQTKFYTSKYPGAGKSY